MSLSFIDTSFKCLTADVSFWDMYVSLHILSKV
jgi:hypothetical protein